MPRTNGLWKAGILAGPFFLRSMASPATVDAIVKCRLPEQVEQDQKGEDAADGPEPARNGCTMRWRDGARHVARRLAGRRDNIVEAFEKVVRHFSSHSVDQSRADLCKFAAYARARLIGQQGGVVAFRHEPDWRAALAESGSTAGAFECERVGIRRIQIGKLQLAGELCFHRTDCSGHRYFVFVVRYPLDTFAARDAGL